MTDNIEEIGLKFGLSVLKDLTDAEFVLEKIQKVTYAFAKQHTLLPIGEKEGKLLVAISSPFQMEALEEVRLQTKLEVQEILCPKEVIETAIDKCYHQKEDAASILMQSLYDEAKGKPSEEEEDGYDLFEQVSDSPVIKMLNMMLMEAIGQGASDVHFEPLEHGMGVRYRIDGVLQMRHAPPKEYQTQLITRIKVMSKLDIAEHRLPQDGRIKLKMGKKQIDFRVSTVPTVFGERIVLRILDKSNVLVGLNKLGIRPEVLDSFNRQIRLSEGIFLVTGPTGSGKTTTLYSALSEINSAEINIMTIEDPVEYKLQGMAQIGVNPKINLTFATGLRHILRQDPDVIMIGEIRDRETAEIAIQASLTGHLVLSTLHTNDAPSAITRLVDMGIEPYLLSSSIVGVLAQRLVRKICPHCRISYAPTQRELTELGIEADELFKGSGCEHCFNTGYKGRCGIYELMNVTGSIKRQIVQSADATELQKIAFETGMLTLRKEGGFLVKQAVTTSAEVLRVSRGCDDASL